MIPAVADRVKETTVTSGLGPIALDGAAPGFRGFAAAIGAGLTCYYAIVHRSAPQWEVGIGTIVSAAQLNRTTLLASSTGAFVDFAAGTKDVFSSIPAVVFDRPHGPPPVVLAPGAIVTIDAALSDYFTLTAGQSFTLANPTNPMHGRKLVVRILQDVTGGRVLTLDTKWRLGTDIPAVVLTTAPNKADYLGAIYDQTADRWDVIAFSKGY